MANQKSCNIQLFLTKRKLSTIQKLYATLIEKRVPYGKGLDRDWLIEQLINKVNCTHFKLAVEQLFHPERVKKSNPINETKLFKNIDNLDLWLNNTTGKIVERIESFKILRWICFLISSNMFGREVVCIVKNYDFRMQIQLGYKSNGLGRITLLIDKKRNKVIGAHVQSDLLDQLDKCKGNGIALLQLSTKDVGGSRHSNALVIDLKNKTIERFEPHGQKGSTVAFIDKFFETKLLREHFRGFTYIRPEQFCPYIGPQTLGAKHKRLSINKNDGGYCVPFTLLYMHLRLIHPDFNRDRVVKMMLNGGPQKVHERIVKFMIRVNETVPSDLDGLIKFDKRYVFPLIGKFRKQDLLSFMKDVSDPDSL